jgi:hypothetical protein
MDTLFAHKNKQKKKPKKPGFKVKQKLLRRTTLPRRYTLCVQWRTQRGSLDDSAKARRWFVVQPAFLYLLSRTV